jgi:hypothetical protein
MAAIAAASAMRFAAGFERITHSSATAEETKG